MGLSYTRCNSKRVTPFFGPLIIIRSQGEKTLIVISLLFFKNYGFRHELFLLKEKKIKKTQH